MGIVKEKNRKEEVTNKGVAGIMEDLLAYARRNGGDLICECIEDGFSYENCSTRSEIINEYDRFLGAKIDLAITSSNVGCREVTNSVDFNYDDNSSYLGEIFRHINLLNHKRIEIRFNEFCIVVDLIDTRKRSTDNLCGRKVLRSLTALPSLREILNNYETMCEK